jgi:DNA-binding response OmpR family regulator
MSRIILLGGCRRGAGLVSRNVLVVEDDHDLARLVALHLADIGCSVQIAHDGPSGLASARSGKHDLVILDRMLPGLRARRFAWEICSSIPVVVMPSVVASHSR